MDRTRVAAAMGWLIKDSGTQKDMQASLRKTQEVFSLLCNIWKQTVEPKIQVLSTEQ